MPTKTTTCTTVRRDAVTARKTSDTKPETKRTERRSTEEVRAMAKKIAQEHRRVFEELAK